MSRDRFISFKDTPRQEALEVEVRKYFGEYATDISWQEDRWYVTLVGADRWIEIWFAEDSADVMTRMMDSATNALADGLAEKIAQTFRGILS